MINEKSADFFYDILVDKVEDGKMGIPRKKSKNKSKREVIIC